MALMNVPLDPSRTGEEAGSLEAGLRQRIVGQEDAVRQIVDLYQMYLTGLNYPGRPVGNLLFLGPTGSGKTRIVEAVAEDEAAIETVAAAEVEALEDAALANEDNAEAAAEAEAEVIAEVAAAEAAEEAVAAEAVEEIVEAVAEDEAELEAEAIEAIEAVAAEVVEENTAS